MKPATRTAVVVRPADDVDFPALDPKAFASGVEYRKALIGRQKDKTRPGKEAVMAVAAECHLRADAAATLNVVTVHGKAGDILSFLEKAPVSHVLLNEEFTAKLPKPAPKKKPGGNFRV